jgi:hypothetical protein
MKIVITPKKPRNPLVAPAHFRRAGSHRPRTTTQRREGERVLRRELDAMKNFGP